MTSSRARLEVEATGPGTGVIAAAASQPQRWGAVRQTGGWVEAVHQLLGDGVFAGDVQRTSIIARHDAHLVVRGLTATPARRGADGGRTASAIVTHIRAEVGATVIHLPGPLLPQAGADHTAALRIEVQTGARVLAATIIVPGRTGMQERGDFERLRLRTVAHVAGALAFAEDADFRPATAGIDGPAVFNGFGAALSILVLGAWDAATVEWWSSFGHDRLVGGATPLRSGGVCVRALGRTLGDVLEALATIEARARALPRQSGEQLAAAVHAAADIT